MFFLGGCGSFFSEAEGLFEGGDVAAGCAARRDVVGGVVGLLVGAAGFGDGYCVADGVGFPVGVEDDAATDVAGCTAAGLDEGCF